MFIIVKILSTDCVSEYRVWYRHSGEEEIDKIPVLPDRKLMSIDDILTIDVGTNYITHMRINLWGEMMMPQLGVVCPQATHLKIVGIESGDSIKRYVLI